LPILATSNRIIKFLPIQKHHSSFFHLYHKTSLIFLQFKAKQGEELLPIIPFHNLRHTNATLLLDGGVDITIVSHRLGHHSVTVTEIYTCLSVAMQTAASSALDNILLPINGGENNRENF
jgi:integrase